MNSQAMRVAERPDRGGINIFLQAMITGLLVVVSVGYVFMWIIMPTNAYRQTWLPKLRAQTNSTYFGTQGTSILIYTFPPLFVAALSCVYLHLAKTHSGSQGNITRNRLAVWRRPLIIKGLGIVSCIELAFFVMFIALLVWSFATYLHIGFSKITPASAAMYGEKV